MFRYVSLAVVVIAAMRFIPADPATGGGAEPSPAVDSTSASAPAEAAARWRQLPPVVDEVRVAPDGRLWSRVDGFGKWPPDREQVRKQIEESYRAADPIIRDAEFKLFDDRGRIWVAFAPEWNLHGYDGRTWIERPKWSDEEPFSGHCPTRGQWRDGTSPAAGGGVCYFPTKFGVHRFDGGRWTYHRIAGENPAYPHRVRLALSPGGRHAVACRGDGEGIWNCVDGTWTRLPIVVPSKKPIQSLVVTDSGALWYLLDGGELQRYVLYGDPTVRNDRMDHLLAELGSAEYERREAATNELRILAPQIRTQLSAALAKTTDAEVRRRLTSVIASEIGKDTPPLKLLFGHDVAGIQALYQDDQGRLIFSAERIDDTGPAVIVVEPAGKVRIIADRELAHGIRAQTELEEYESRPPVAVPSGDAAWCPVSGASHGPVLVDLAKETVTVEVDDLRMAHIRAVATDGRVYVSSQAFTGHILVFDPRIVDRRLPLEVTTLENVDLFEIASDGAVWARRNEKELLRFDGREWAVMQELRGNSLHLIAGSDDVMLVGGLTTTASLYRGDRLIDRRPGFRQLIENHRELIVRNFRLPPEPTRRPYGNLGSSVDVAVDGRGDPWLRIDNNFAVLLPTGWRDIFGLPEPAGSPHRKWHFLTPIGDELYISDLDRTAHVKSYRTRAAVGEYEFHETPSAIDRGFRDAAGRLWIGARDATEPDSIRRQSTEVAIRVDQFGPPLVVKGYGKPFLVDHADQVWLHRTESRASPAVTIWHDGRVKGRLPLLGTDGVKAAFSDRPGSVYLRVVGGLQHVAADKLSGEYRLGPLYAIDGAPRYQRRSGYSKLGYLIIHGGTNDPGRRSYLALVKLPKP